MIRDLISEIVFSSVGRIWPWLQKKIYSLSEFEKDIEIDTRRENPLTFSITGESPYWCLYLEVKNKSQYIPFTFDRAIIGIATDSPHSQIIRNVSLINKIEVDKKSMNPLFLKFDLNEHQVKILSKIKDGKEFRATISITYYITSNLYTIERKIQLTVTHYVIQ